MDVVWWYWLILAGVLLIFEMFTGTFAFLIFSIGTIGGLILNLCGLSLVWQVVGFAVVCIITFIIFKLNPGIWSSKSNEKFCSDSIVGAKGVVVGSVNKEGGMVKINGEECSAFSD